MCNCCCCGLTFWCLCPCSFWPVVLLWDCGGVGAFCSPVRSRWWRDFIFWLFFKWKIIANNVLQQSFLYIDRVCVYVLYDALNYHLGTKHGLENQCQMTFTYSKCLILMSSFSGVISMFVLIIKHVDLWRKATALTWKLCPRNIFQVWQPLWMETQTGPTESLLLICVCLYN